MRRRKRLRKKGKNKNNFYESVEDFDVIDPNGEIPLYDFVPNDGSAFKRRRRHDEEANSSDKVSKLTHIKDGADFTDGFPVKGNSFVDALCQVTESQT